jgi:hypothetical protein
VTGENLPADLEAQAKDSPLLRQLARSDGFAKMQPGQGATAAAPAAPSGPSAAAQAAAKPASSVGNKPSTGGGAAASGPPAASTAQKAKSPEYGMNVFIWGNKNTTDRDLTKIKDAGFGWQKTLFQWRFIEPQKKGVFDWEEADRIVMASKAAGVKILARLDQQPAWARADHTQKNAPPDNMQDYADFITAFVTRYSSTSPIGRVDAIQIWNEQNLNNEWGGAPINQAQAQTYVRMLKAAYIAAKAADPSVTVVTGGVAQTGTDTDDARPDDTYVQWMYDAGAKPYFDVLGAHGHGYKAPPNVSPDEAEQNQTYGGHRFFVFRRVEDMRKIMVDNGDSDKQIWLLEFGWTSDTVHQAYAWHRVTEEEKGNNLVGAYQWAAEHWAPWIGVMCLWTMPDPGWTQDDEKYWWAILNPDGSARPAYTALLNARKNGTLP